MDPFDQKDCPVFKELHLMVKWHPRIRMDELPSWLAHYVVGHFKGTDLPSESSAVHRLFFSLFCDKHDRSTMMPVILKGETLAVLTPDQKIAVSAMTFVECSTAVVIFFLATHDDFRNIGMASFLLKLMYHRIWIRTGKTVKVFLKTNRVASPDVFEWYTNSCKFDELQRVPNFPFPLKTWFASFDLCDTPLSNYLEEEEGEECTNLIWLRKYIKASDAVPVPEQAKCPLNKRFFYDPYSTNWLADNDPSVYAHLPGDLSLHELEHCAPDDSETLLSHDFFATPSSSATMDAFDIDPDFLSLPGNNPVRLSWVSRCFLTAPEPLMDVEYFAVVIAWLQRHRDARIWTECLTIVPVSMMRDLSIMQHLFNEYQGSKLIDDECDASMMFHPLIDNSRFMDASIPVMHFILENKKDLLSKPYIALIVEEDTVHTLSCFISFNAGQIGAEPPEDKSQVLCGYLHFCPILEEGGDVMTMPPPPCAFFLSLAQIVATCDEPPMSGCKRGTGSDHSVAPWFQSIHEFAELFAGKQNYGYENSERPSTFVRLSISSGYPLLNRPANRLDAFLFLLDFCTSIVTLEPIIWGKEQFLLVSDRFELAGMGKALPVSVQELSAYRNRMLLNILQVIDRIAETQLPSRTVTKEYTAFIKHKKATATLKMPSARKQFRDCVGKSWKPLHRQAKLPKGPSVAGDPKPHQPVSTENVEVVPSADLLRSICAQVPIYAKDYRNSMTLAAKEDILWTLLRYAHKASPIPGFVETLKAIDARLMQGPVKAAVAELGEKDVVEGVRSRLYHARVSDFLEEFRSASSRVARAKVVTSVVQTLRIEGFRFLTECQEGWQEMDFSSTVEKVRKLLYWFTRSSTMKAEEPLDAAPAAAPAAAEDAAYGAKDILIGRLSASILKHPANVAYRQKVSDVTLAFQDASSKDGRREVCGKVIDDLQKEGYRFVAEFEGIWKEVTSTKVRVKVDHDLRDRGRIKKTAGEKVKKTVGEKVGKVRIKKTAGKKRKVGEMIQSSTEPGTATTGVTGTGGVETKLVTVTTTKPVTVATADVDAELVTVTTADVDAELVTVTTADVDADFVTVTTADVEAELVTVTTADVEAELVTVATTERNDHMDDTADVVGGIYVEQRRNDDVTGMAVMEAKMDSDSLGIDEDGISDNAGGGNGSTVVAVPDAEMSERKSAPKMTSESTSDCDSLFHPEEEFFEPPVATRTWPLPGEIATCLLTPTYKGDVEWRGGGILDPRRSTGDHKKDEQNEKKFANKFTERQYTLIYGPKPKKQKEVQCKCDCAKVGGWVCVRYAFNDGVVDEIPGKDRGLTQLEKWTFPSSNRYVVAELMFARRVEVPCVHLQYHIEACWDLLLPKRATLRSGLEYSRGFPCYYVEVVDCKTTYPIDRFLDVERKDDDAIIRQAVLKELMVGIEGGTDGDHRRIPLGALSAATFLGAKAVYFPTESLRDMFARRFSTHLPCKGAFMDSNSEFPSCGEIYAPDGNNGETTTFYKLKYVVPGDKDGCSFAYYDTIQDVAKWKATTMYGLRREVRASLDDLTGLERIRYAITSIKFGEEVDWVKICRSVVFAPELAYLLIVELAHRTMPMSNHSMDKILGKIGNFVVRNVHGVPRGHKGDHRGWKLLLQLAAKDKNLRREMMEGLSEDLRATLGSFIDIKAKPTLDGPP